MNPSPLGMIRNSDSRQENIAVTYWSKFACTSSKAASKGNFIVICSISFGFFTYAGGPYQGRMHHIFAKMFFDSRYSAEFFDLQGNGRCLFSDRPRVVPRPMQVPYSKPYKMPIANATHITTRFLKTGLP